jgi:hypothetical protein
MGVACTQGYQGTLIGLRCLTRLFYFRGVGWLAGWRTGWLDGWLGYVFFFFWHKDVAQRSSLQRG